MTKQRERERFDGYAVELFLDEYNDWLAHLVELPGISAFGSTPEKALKELDVAWAAAKESYVARAWRFPRRPRGDSTTAYFRCASISAYIARSPSRRNARA